jgi:myosin-5
MQSCIRRRYARRRLRALKTEARSASKFKEISYKLENKVVELTQTLQARTMEKKELQGKLTELERQLQSWIAKHEETDARSKQLQNDIQTLHVPKTRYEELIEAKRTIDEKLEESARKVVQQDEEIRSLTAELERQTQEMDAKVKAARAEATTKGPENTASFVALKQELSNLRDQLNRANALNALTRTREPTSPGLKTFDSVQPLTTSTTVNSINGNAHRRRHSTAGVYSLTGHANPENNDFIDMKRSQNPRAVSVVYNGLENPLRFRGNGLSNIYDDPSEEKVKLLEDAEHLDEDILDGLVRNLKIPVPNLTNPPSIREVLFPANLIALVTNEMWKFGLIPESERFLANVMQTIQAHVMV